jgi:hypothetical protein
VRWFFRPVESRLIGYTGFFKRASKSVAKKTASKAAVKKAPVEEEEDEDLEASSDGSD